MSENYAEDSRSEIPYLSAAMGVLHHLPSEDAPDTALRLAEAQAWASVALTIAVRELVEVMRDRS